MFIADTSAKFLFIKNLFTKNYAENGTFLLKKRRTISPFYNIYPTFAANIEKIKTGVLKKSRCL